MNLKILFQRLFDRNTFLGQMMRYGIVGVIAFIVDYGILWLLTDGCGLHYLVSAAISFSIAFVCNYLLSIKFVFGESRVKSRVAEFGSFLLIAVTGLILNEVIMYVCSGLFGMHYMLSKVVATVLVFFWNFLARKFLLFKS